MAQDSAGKIPRFIRRVMSGASEVELMEAAERFTRYMAIMRGIYERVGLAPAEGDSPDPPLCGRVANTDPDV